MPEGEVQRVVFGVQDFAPDGFPITYMVTSGYRLANGERKSPSDRVYFMAGHFETGTTPPGFEVTNEANALAREKWRHEYRRRHRT